MYMSTRKRLLGEKRVELRTEGEAEVCQAEAPVSIDDFIIPNLVYSYPQKTEVPPGFYLSEIKSVEARRSKKGRKCLDVCYVLQGSTEDYYVRQSYPQGSTPLEGLYKAMIDAGVPTGHTMRSAIGIMEKVRLVYDDDDAIGRFSDRCPYHPADPDVEDDEDDDDLLALAEDD